MKTQPVPLNVQYLKPAQPATLLPEPRWPAACSSSMAWIWLGSTISARPSMRRSVLLTGARDQRLGL